MTGMKEGAGEDPFADDDPADAEPGGERESTTSRSRSDPDPDTTRGTRADRGQMQIPYIYRRESVQDNRDRVPLFLQDETKRAEREALRELEERFDDDVSLTDLREALVKVGLEHLDEVEGQLERWGHGMTFDN